MRSLSRAQVIWLFLVVQVPDASDMRRVPSLLRPFDCFVLGLEGLKDMVRVVFNDVILYGAALTHTEHRSSGTQTNNAACRQA